MDVNILFVISLATLTLFTLLTETVADCVKQCRDRKAFLARFAFSQAYLDNIYLACMAQCSHPNHDGSEFVFGRRVTTTESPWIQRTRPTNPPVVWTHRSTNPPVVWTRRSTNPPVVWTSRPTNPPVVWTRRTTNPPVVWTQKPTNSPVIWISNRTKPPQVWTPRWTNPTWRQTTKTPLQYGCGERSRYSNRIIGGYPTEPCEFPWIVVVKTPGLFCAGSIIDKRHILTAAHCIKNLFSGVVAAPSQVEVKLGSSRQSRLRKVKVVQVHVHPKHNIYRDYDLAIVTLEKELIFGPCIAPVCIPHESQRAEDMDECVVAGWGVMDRRAIDRRQPDLLRKVSVPIVSRDKCMSSYGGRHFNDLKLCAGNYKMGGQDSCKGDSGGPLVCRKKNGPYSVFGIVSFGNQCAKPLYPGVYTRVNHPLIKQYIIESTQDNTRRWRNY